MKRIIWIIIIVLLIAGMTIRLKASHDKINNAKPNSGLSNIVNVNVAEVIESETSHTLDLTGILSPESEINIAAQTQGQITSINFELGQYKVQGSTIAVIDNELKQLAVKSARLNESKLKRDLERYQNLYDGGTTTEQQLDEIRNAYESAVIQLKQAEKQLSDATVTAPFSGVITQRLSEQGAFVNIGTPIASIIDISKLKIKINVSESNIYQINKGDQATVSIDIFPNVEFKGTVTFISDRGDDYHNYPVEVVIPNSKQYPLKAGTFANVRINIPGTAKALSIPREALIGSTQDASVYVVENNKAILRQITVINSNGANLPVLSGLIKGEKVVVTGQINLVDGKHVNIIEN
jgi:membrane fusion protein, multidrug efflux system